MTIKEKILQIIALAMSIKATDSYFLSIDWDSNHPNRVDIFVHKRKNGISKGVVEHYVYDGRNRIYDYYVSYETMIDWLNRMKREWGEV